MRVAPNQNFKYVDPKLLKLYLKLRSPRSLPSMLLPMACQEFAQRMQKDCNLPNLVYKQAEFYYMQVSFRKASLLPQPAAFLLGWADLSSCLRAWAACCRVPHVYPLP